MTTLFLFALLAQDPLIAAPRSYKLEFENEWVRVIRVRHPPHDKTPVHDFPALPAVEVYVSDSGRLRIQADKGDPVIQAAVKAGTIRYTRGVASHRTVEELDGIPSEMLRIELKMKPVDLPERDVVIAPESRDPYEGGMLRILRVTCPARATCPQSEHSDAPAIVIIDRGFVWQNPGLQLDLNGKSQPLDEVRIELKSRP